MAEIRWININIGCIETALAAAGTAHADVININIGCIETGGTIIGRYASI